MQVVLLEDTPRPLQRLEPLEIVSSCSPESRAAELAFADTMVVPSPSFAPTRSTSCLQNEGLPQASSLPAVTDMSTSGAALSADVDGHPPKRPAEEPSDAGRSRSPRCNLEERLDAVAGDIPDVDASFGRREQRALRESQKRIAKENDVNKGKKDSKPRGRGRGGRGRGRGRGKRAPSPSPPRSVSLSVRSESPSAHEATGCQEGPCRGWAQEQGQAFCKDE